MKQLTKYVGLVAIVAIFAIATISGSIDEADAVKAKGTYKNSPKSYGSANHNIVCGAKLCSSGEIDPINVGKTT